jgi:hypothetical protein
MLHCPFCQESLRLHYESNVWSLRDDSCDNLKAYLCDRCGAEVHARLPRSKDEYMANQKKKRQEEMEAP